MNALDKILEKRLVPVAVIEREDDAVPLMEALIAGGLNVIEVTLRTAAAMGAMRAIRDAFPDVLVGAGTVLDVEPIAELAGMGVGFVVSPGINEKVVEAAMEEGLPATPGVATPTEVERGRALGCRVLKFFPAENLGGANMLKALAGPYGHTGLQFIPTGGVNLELAKNYWALPVVAAVGGSWFVKKELVADGRFDAITEMTREAVQLAAAS